MRRLVSVDAAAAADLIPLARRTIINGHHLGRYPWVTWRGPEGRRTSCLWIDLDLLLAWAHPRGLQWASRLVQAMAASAAIAEDQSTHAPSPFSAA